MRRAERIIIANDNAPFIQRAERQKRVKARRNSRQNIGRNKALPQAHTLSPGQMQWQPEKVSQSYTAPLPPLEGRIDIDDESLNLGQIFLVSLFTVLLVASITSLFYGLRKDIIVAITAMTSFVAIVSLCLPKSHRRKREFLSLTAWVTGLIALNIYFPLNTIELLTVASLLGFSLSMMARLVSPAVAGTLTLACLVAVILPQTGLV